MDELVALELHVILMEESLAQEAERHIACRGVSADVSCW